MKRAQRIVGSCVALAVLVWISGCGSAPVGPSHFSITVGPLSLAPTADDAAVCCCRVVGTAKNQNRVPVHATFTFTAYDADRQRPISKTLFSINDFGAGTERPIDAHGFIYPCNVIKDLATEVDVRGIAFPPL
jgi:hypothetical protein